tara:strand:- start:2168 stop:4156 length:1989 start_codon:yes stop_codon:yes gene_type:complete
MMKFLSLSFLVSLFICSGALAQEAAGPEPAPVAAQPPAPQDKAERDFIPIKTFTAPGHIHQPLISPDGKRIIYREKIGEKNYLTILTIDKDKEKKRLGVPLRLNWYRWAGNDRLIFSVGNSFSFLGTPILVPGLYSYQLSTGDYEKLSDRNQVLAGGTVLHVDRYGRYIIMAAQDSVRDYPSVFRVHLTDKQVVKIVDEQDRINEWVADGDGVIRMGLSFRGRSMRVFYRRNDGEEFDEIGRVKFKGEEEDIETSLYDIIKIVADSDEGYLLSNRDTGRFALYKFNYATREFGEKIFDHPDNDVTDYQLNDDGSKLLSVSYTDTRDRKAWFDDKYKNYQSALEQAVPGQEVWIQSSSDDDERMVIFTTSSTDPGSYYLFEPGARKLDRFGGINDSIDPVQLSPTKPVSYKARDGLTIHAYLTLPRSAPPKMLPLIIFPHGGPFGVRDTPDFNRDVQFLADRGYAVLQPNYRGSSSYGEAFHLAGEGEIGRKMQDDLDDGMDWLVEQGIADRTRVCIYGASYGGYAAIWGLIRNPERYRCGISYAGVTHWKKQLRYSTKFFRSRYRKELRDVIRGDDDFDLDAVSPAETIERLQRPLLVGQGKRDRVVPEAQFDLLVKRAEKADIKLETKLYANDGHDLVIRKNQQDWYKTLESFLRKYNPAF